MPIIQCDIREGWTDEQKADLSKRISEAVHKANTDAPPEHIHVVIREARGLHYRFGGEIVPEYEPPS